MTKLLLGVLGALALGAACAEATPPDAGGGAGGSSGSQGDAGGIDAKSCQLGNGGDDDEDGFDESEDCNDCDPLQNPGAYDFAGDGKDDDCSGSADDEPSGCDDGTTIESTDPWDAVFAAGWCRTIFDQGRHERAWAVLSAKLVKPDGMALPDPLSHGMLPRFGVNLPRQGSHMLALSSGSARDPSMAGYQDILGYRKGYTSGTPDGYPKESPACPGVVTGAAHDGAALELTVRVPTNVKSFEVSENFFTLEFPGYVCSKYNDYFVIDLDPKVPQYEDGNVAFDALGNPISVNNGLLQVCLSQVAGGKLYDCPLGVGELSGTGFDVVDDDFSPAPHAATGWLRTRAPVSPGSVVRIRFSIWDSGDGNLDSTVLIDDLQWSRSADGGTVPVPH